MLEEFWSGVQLCLCLTMVPIDLDPDLQVDFPAWLGTCPLSVDLSGAHWAVFISALIKPGADHWLPSWPEISFIIMGLCELGSWLNLAAVSDPALLSPLRMGPCPAVNITALGSLFLREQLALASSWHHLPQNVHRLLFPARWIGRSCSN